MSSSTGSNLSAYGEILGSLQVLNFKKGDGNSVLLCGYVQSVFEIELYQCNLIFNFTENAECNMNFVCGILKCELK